MQRRRPIGLDRIDVDFAREVRTHGGGITLCRCVDQA
jgi:hypothetical protein